MRILSWVQGKFNRGQDDKRKPDPGLSSARHDYSVAEDAREEEANDWPQALLSIGTFGNGRVRGEADRRDDASENNLDAPEDDTPDFTIEEVNKLHKELTKLLSRKPKSSELRDEGRGSLPLDRFLNCPSSLEVDRTASKKPDDPEDDNNGGDLSPNTKIMLSKLKAALLGNRNSIKKRSFSFLLKKMLFACGSGFAPSPSLRDPIPESRMDKILREILTKKIYPQSSAPRSSKRYHLMDDKPAAGKRRAGKDEDRREDQGKWDKTDSEYIVLEI